MAARKVLGNAGFDDPARPDKTAKTEHERGRKKPPDLKPPTAAEIAKIAPDVGDLDALWDVAAAATAAHAETLTAAPRALASTGLTATQRSHARDVMVDAAQIGLAHKADLHYTQSSPQRWDGISNDREVKDGEWPHYADCSAFYTWCAWNGLFLPYHVEDVVNNGGWKWGNTWSMLQNGARVWVLDNVLRGDAVLYGQPSHTAPVVGWDVDARDGKTKPFVISNGSEGGPYYLPYDYRSDIHSVRRFVLP